MGKKPSAALCPYSLWHHRNAARSTGRTLPTQVPAQPYRPFHSTLPRLPGSAVVLASSPEAGLYSTTTGSPLSVYRVLRCYCCPSAYRGSIRHHILYPVCPSALSARFQVCPSARVPVCPSPVSRLPACPRARDPAALPVGCRAELCRSVRSRCRSSLCPERWEKGERVTEEEGEERLDSRNFVASSQSAGSAKVRSRLDHQTRAKRSCTTDWDEIWLGEEGGGRLCLDE
ncbi:unnamed protein product [Calypogeia fissa]